MEEDLNIGITATATTLSLSTVVSQLTCSECGFIYTDPVLTLCCGFVCCRKCAENNLSRSIEEKEDGCWRCDDVEMVTIEDGVCPHVGLERRAKKFLKNNPWYTEGVRKPKIEVRISLVTLLKLRTTTISQN